MSDELKEVRTAFAESNDRQFEKGRLPHNIRP